MKVIHWIALGLIGALLYLAATGFSAYEQNRYFYDARATVRMLEHQEEPWSGSAVIIAPGRLLTAAHLFYGDSEGYWMVVDGDAGTLPLDVEYLDHDADIAIISADVDCPCASLAETVPYTYDEVFIIGHPLGISLPVLTDGRLQGHLDPYTFLTTAQAAAGNSGGGTFAIMDGKLKLIGILVDVRVEALFTPIGFLPTSVHHLSGSVRPEVIQRALACLDKGETEESWCQFGDPGGAVVQ